MEIKRSSDTRILKHGEFYSLTCPKHGPDSRATIYIPEPSRDDFNPAVLQCDIPEQYCPNDRSHTLEEGPRVAPERIYDLLGDLQFMHYCIECGENVMARTIWCSMTDGIEHVFDQRTNPYRPR